MRERERERDRDRNVFVSIGLNIFIFKLLRAIFVLIYGSAWSKGEIELTKFVIKYP